MKLRILVRARKDAKAVTAAMKTFYPGFDVEVDHLGGLRGEALAAEALSKATPFTIILLPRGEAGRLDSGGLPALVRLVEAPARDVRNLRLEQIAGLVARGRALLRLAASWSVARGSYILDGPDAPPGVEANPNIDNTILYGGGLGWLSSLLGRKIGGHALLYIGEDRVVVHHSGRAVAVVDPRPEPPRVVELHASLLDSQYFPSSLEGVVEANKSLVETIISSVASWLREAAGKPSRVIVPWSGGKDSTAALVVAVRAFGPERVTAIRVDTGGEFPDMSRYIDRAASLLGVEVIEARALLREAILSGRGLPRRGERWCTGLKLEALASAVRKLARSEPRPVVVVGDRDAESRARSRRPPARSDPYHGLPTLAPLKLLGGAHVLLISHATGLGAARIYEEGFYRVGCYICPYMRGWERSILRLRLRRRLEEEDPWASRLLSMLLGGGDGN